VIDAAPAEDEFTAFVPSLERQLFRGFEEPRSAGDAEEIQRGKAA